VRGLAAALLFSVAAGVAGCASAPVQTTPAASTPPAAASPTAEPQRVATGRLALAVEAHEGRPAQGFNASFELNRLGPASELLLAAATGQQLARLSWDETRVELQTPERGVQRFASLASLSRQMFGEELPLAALPDWLVGRPSAASPSTPTASGFVQAGWSLDLSRQADGLIVARRELPPAIALRVRLEPV
jgi:outer membrane lipoprotein LolB